MAWTKKSVGPVVQLSEITTGSNKVLNYSDLPQYQSEIDIVGIRIEIAASATVGNRSIKVRLYDTQNSDDIIMELGLPLLVTANGSGVWEIICGSVPLPKQFSAATTADLDRAVDGVIYTGGPRILFADGYKLGVFDATAVDASGDTLVVHIRGLGI